MYLETYSMEELMELIEEKGYCSVEGSRNPERNGTGKKRV